MPETDATPSSPQPAEDLVDSISMVDAWLKALPERDRGSLLWVGRDEVLALRAALARERELREALVEVVDTSRRLPRSVARPAGERPYELTSPSFDRAIEKAKALLAQPAAGEERERG